MVPNNASTRGNGDDYKQVPNEQKQWEIEAYPLLLAEVRAAVGREKLITAAVPGLPRDMLAFTSQTVPRILDSVDFLNVMTYEMLNRRDNVTKHHAGKALSRASLQAYIAAGAPPHKLNLGFAFQTKYARTLHRPCTGNNPVGCPTPLMEDPETGADLGHIGAFAWADEPPAEVRASFLRAVTDGVYDVHGGGYYYWDADEDLFWTHETPHSIADKFDLVREFGLGGVFAWELGGDGPEYTRLAAVNAAVTKWNSKDEL